MSYQDSDIAKQYIEFTNSKNGQIQQEVLFSALSKYLNPSNGKELLDVACGGGWLAEKLSEQFNVKGCDFSPELIDYAKRTYGNKAEFEVADVTQSLPYSPEQFDTIIFNMAAHDVHDLNKSFEEISRVAKPGAQILMTVANPYYAFPVGVWKRGYLGFLLRRMPRLLLRPYFSYKRQPTRQFTWNNKFTSYFYTLPEYIDTARSTGLALEALEDMESSTDTDTFTMRYQLYRFPIMLMLVYRKK